MVAKKSVFENKARRSFWSIHIEAWRKSGVGQEAYCGQHRLSRNTFRRWLEALDAAGVLSAHRARKRPAQRPVRKGMNRSRALLAFWSMHVEALQWSGLRTSEYARVHHLSVDSLRHWRKQLTDDPTGFDWRQALHPAARPAPKLSSELSSAANFCSAQDPLTSAPAVDPKPDGRSNRRLFTDEEKLAIVRESEQPGVSAAAICRRHGIVTSMLFRWRVQFGMGQDMSARLATVRLQERRGRGRPRVESAALVLHDLLPVPDGLAAFELADGRRVFAPADSDPEAVRRYVAEQESAR